MKRQCISRGFQIRAFNFLASAFEARQRCQQIFGLNRILRSIAVAGADSPEGLAVAINEREPRKVQTLAVQTIRDNFPVLHQFVVSLEVCLLSRGQAD